MIHCKMFGLVQFCLQIVLVCSWVIPNTILGSEAAPDVYFYSSVDSAFIIQQAGGENRRVLTTFELPEGHIQIVGAGWSPTGEWFSWMSRGSGGRAAPNVHIVDYAGRAAQAIFSQSAAVFDAQWSPTEDYLLIRYWETPDQTIDNIAVYNPAVAEVVFTLRGESFNPTTLETAFVTAWSRDGNYLLVQDNASNRLLVIDSDQWNVQQEIRVGRTNLPYGDALPRWLTDDRFAYLSGDQSTLVVQAINESSIEHIPLPNGEVVSGLFPSIDGRYALLSGSSEDSPLFLVSFETATLQFLLAGADLSILRIPTISENATYWSGRWAYFRDIGGNLYVLDATSGEFREVPLETPSLSIQPTWDENSHLIFYANDRLLQYIPQTTSIQDYALRLASSLQPAIIGSEMQITNPAYGSFVGVMHMRFYPNGEWAFLLSDRINDVHLVNLANLWTGGQQELGLCPLDSRSCYGWLPEGVNP